MKLPTFLYLFSLTIVLSTAHAQVINGYAKVTNVSSRTLTLSNVNEVADSFEDDEWVVVMQMQDNVIGTTTNTAGFGNLGSINSAGLYEIRQIESHTESGGVPNSITLKNVPNNTYSTCSNCSVQIITFRKFGSPNYTTTTDMSALTWDGNIGGVIAMYVDGVFTLGHNIDADYSGFRGAGTNAGGSGGCDGASHYRVSTTANYADKGEGIYKYTNTNYAAGKAHILSGGGGGNSHNAGGGGGSNYSAGGDGGPGWPTCTPSAGGIGGVDLSGSITVSRVFMGGGGGAGEGNNSFATKGEDGGGIVLIKAQELTTAACGGVRISTNGNSIVIAPGNDGAGGGGAGGSIVLEIEAWSIAGACTLTVSANGGNGGNVNSTAVHGGGGGGGQGVVFYSIVEPTSNITTETNNGSGGCNNNSDPCLSSAGNGGGVSGAGIFDELTGPLPIELIAFDATLINNNVSLNWITKSERNNSFFTIEQSENGIDWKIITTLDGAGNSSETLKYTTWDFNPCRGISYYRLKQTDFNGEYSYSTIQSIKIESNSILIYPNPAKDVIIIEQSDNTDLDYFITDALGRFVPVNPIKTNSTQTRIDISHLPNGLYSIRIRKDRGTENYRFIIQH